MKKKRMRKDDDGDEDNELPSGVSIGKFLDQFSTLRCVENMETYISLAVTTS